MFNPDNSELTITHDNEIAYILSKFNEDFIYTTVIESLNNRLSYSTFQVMPNIVQGYETTFKQILSEYPSAKELIIQKREEVYTNIIKILCDFYQLRYEDYDTYDLYTSAHNMYDLLVSGFRVRAEEFFISYITKEKNGLYSSLCLNEQKKNKDISTLYGKKVFADSRMAVICSNLETVLLNICQLDVPLNMYIEMAGYDISIANHLNTVIAPINDFFKTYISVIMNSEYAIPFMTNIKLRLQNYNMSDDTAKYITDTKQIGSE